MTQRIYKNLKGMTLEYVSGRLEQRPEERTIRYTVSFDMGLDFTHFVQMANVYSPGYLNSPVNAIRPELDGLAYHYSYNYLFSSAGNIRDNEALFELFTSPGNYMDQWAATNDLEMRYGKPVFGLVESKLRITAHQDFRVLGESRQIEIEDLPIIRFQWALNLLEGHARGAWMMAPETKVVLMYAHEDLVEVEGLQMFRGTRYINSRQLSFGNISPSQILTAQ